MPCSVLPKSIWTHIRSFSGDMVYEPTPSARLIRDLCFCFDLKGNYQFPEFGCDGYSSLIVHTSGKAFFQKPSHKCRNRDSHYLCSLELVLLEGVSRRAVVGNVIAMSPYGFGRVSDTRVTVALTFHSGYRG